MMLETAAVQREETNEDDAWTRKAKKMAAVESSQTTWKAKTGLPYIRRHPSPPRELPRWRQAQRDPSNGRENLITVCAFERP